MRSESKIHLSNVSRSSNPVIFGIVDCLRKECDGDFTPAFHLKEPYGMEIAKTVPAT